MIKAIIFDYGNVISTVLNSTFLADLSQFSDKTAAELQGLVNGASPLLRDFETGRISSGEFYKGAVKLGGLKISEDEFMKLFTARFKPVEETPDLIRKLKTRYRIGLLSNTNVWDFKYQITPCEVFKLFDTVTVSFKVGAMKPDEKIYLDALLKLGFRPDECVYIDDIKDYVDAASVLGIKGIHYTSHENLVETLRSLKCLP